METGLAKSLGGKSPAAGREMHAKPGSHSLPGAEIKAAPPELCSEPDLVTVIDGLRSSQERAGDEEWTQSRAGSTTVEGRHKVLALRGQGTPRAPCCKEGTQISGTQRIRKGQGWSPWSSLEPGSQHPWVWQETGVSTR